VATRGVVLVNGKKISFNYHLPVAGEKRSRLLLFNLPNGTLTFLELLPIILCELEYKNSYIKLNVKYKNKLIDNITLLFEIQ
jgi:hypothetical protein